MQTVIVVPQMEPTPYTIISIPNLDKFCMNLKAVTFGIKIKHLSERGNLESVLF